MLTNTLDQSNGKMINIEGDTSNSIQDVSASSFADQQQTDETDMMITCAENVCPGNDDQPVRLTFLVWFSASAMRGSHPIFIFSSYQYFWFDHLFYLDRIQR